jgi:hypothetical protein
MLNGKLYVINSPSLISAAMRSKNLSLDPIAIQFATGAAGMSKQMMESIAPAMDQFSHIIHAALGGDDMYKTNARALAYVANALNDIKSGGIHDIPNVFSWIRNLTSMASMTALFGEKNPITPEALEDLWYVIIHSCYVPLIANRQSLTGTPGNMTEASPF